jgi:8-oxo-dGTP pyrophosphatase MutT (NUDIX family)
MSVSDGDYSEMFDEHPPALVRGDKLDLAALGGAGAELSTGLILTWRDWLVYGLEPRAVPLGARGQANVSAFVGIGGHLEPGEGWGAAAIREAEEEASCAVSLGDSPITYLCREDRAPAPIAYAWDEPVRPLLVWQATFNLRRGRERRRMPVNFVNAVFRAAALGQPAPGAEVEALLLMDQETLLATYEAPRPFAELLARGVSVIGHAPAPDRLLAPGGSAFFYAQWLAWQG